MDTNQINNFFAANSKYFTVQQCVDLRNRMLQLPDTSNIPFYASNFERPYNCITSLNLPNPPWLVWN